MSGTNPDAIDGFEVRRFLSKLRQRWKMYAGGVALAVVLTFLFHVYSVPRYLVVSTLLNSTEHVPSVLGDASEIERRNMLNELEILRSTQVMRRAIEHAKLHYDLIERGLLHEVAILDNPPFAITVGISNPEVPLSLQVDFELKDPGQILVTESNTEVIPVGAYSLPMEATSDQVKIRIDSANSEMIGRSYTLKIKDPLTKVLDIREVMSVDLTNTESTVIKIQMESATPQWAIRFIERLILDYQSLKIEHKNESILNSLDFINEQVALIKKKLNQIEYDLVRFREINKTIDINAEGSAVLTTLLDLENQLASKRLQMNYYNQFMDQMNSADSNQVFVNPSAVGITDRVFNEAVTSLNSMILDLNQLRISSTEINPRYQSLERSISHQIELLKSSIDDYRSSTALSIDQLEDRIKEEEREMRRLPSTQKNLISLQREFDMNETMYLFLEERKAEAEILRASNISQVQVIDDPYVFNKVFPKEALNYLIAVLASSFLIYFGTTVYDLSVQKVDTPEDLANKTGRAVIGIVPERRGKELLPSNEAPPSDVTESFRRMSTHLRNGSVNKQFLQVCSATDKEGRTYVAVNLAVMLARYKNKVVIVDANLRNPRVSKFLEVGPSSTMSAYLDGSKEVKDIVSSTTVPHLDVIGGYHSQDGNELLNTPRLTELFEVLKKNYDYIVVDSSPLLPFPDALDLLKYADYKILVVSRTLTPSSSLTVLEDIEAHGSGEIGLVFNRQRQPVI